MFGEDDLIPEYDRGEEARADSDTETEDNKGMVGFFATHTQVISRSQRVTSLGQLTAPIAMV